MDSQPLCSKALLLSTYLCVFYTLQKPTAFQRKNGLRTVVSKLSEAGLQTSMFYSVQQDEVYCKVRAHPDRLKAEADRINLNVRRR